MRRLTECEDCGGTLFANYPLTENWNARRQFLFNVERYVVDWID